MVLLKLEMQAELENLTDFEPTEGTDTFAPVVRIKCGSCREVHDKDVTISPEEDRPMQGSRGTSNFVWNCGFCKRAASANHSKDFKRTSLTADDSDNHQWVTFAVIECRNCEIVSWDPAQSTWKAKGRETTTKFSDIELVDFTDYDEKAAEPVAITEFKSRISRG